MTKPTTKDWRNLPIERWNVTTFTEYLRDKHKEMFGIEYVPYRSWRVEQGLLGNLIGTRAKPQTEDKALVKRFIDEAFSEYRPNPKYPGVSFGWCWTYKKPTWQRVKAEYLAEQKAGEQAEEETQGNVGKLDMDDVLDWL
ncbi:hypothetical protein [Virgibacillus pantothenticus]|uniref:hypothetical protein n=1 Tax=Virgibacillus pantothenticus TaxID=1473 RepID=UPI000984DA3A|nr:hypothetical protein [Virgibacillus pantothenticus]